MPALVCDTSSLIKLAKADALDSLGMLFAPVYLPDAVVAECKSDRIKAAISLPFFTPYQVQNTLAIGLGAGERGAISAAVELGIVHILTDDDAATSKAARHGLVPIRVFDVLLLAKAAGHIQSVKATLDRMRDLGEGIDPGVYAETLRRSGEGQPA